MNLEALSQQIGGPLVILNLKSLVVLGAVGLAVLCLRKASAATRHLVWTSGIVAILLLPLLSAVLPAWNWRSPPATQMAMGNEAPPGATSISSSEGTGPTTKITVPPSDSAGPMGSDWARPDRGLPWLFKLWFAGGAILALRLLVCQAGLWWRQHRLGIVDAPGAGFIRNQAESLCRPLALRRQPALLIGGADRMPMTWGVIRQHILLPAGAHTWSVDRLRAVLSHEIAHIVRRDCLSQLLVQLACCAYWMNPLVWVAAWRIEIEGEYACDDLAVASVVSRPDYAQHLLSLASDQKSHGRRFAAGVLMARPSGLERRIQSLLDGGKDRRAPTMKAAVLGALLLLAFVAPIAVTGADQGAPLTEGASLQEFQNYFDQANAIGGILFQRVAVDSSASLWYFGQADEREFYLHQQDSREAIEKPTSLGVTYGGSATNMWHIHQGSLTVSPIPDWEAVFSSPYDEMNHGAFVARIGLVTLTRARNLGLDLMDPSTASWEGNRFTASTYDKRKLSGAATVENNRVTAIEFQVDERFALDNSKRGYYVVRYRYRASNLPNRLPSEFELFKVSDGRERSTGKTRLVKLDLVERGSLSAEVFDVQRFFSPTRIGQKWEYARFQSGAGREHVGPVLKPARR